jgi:hypothetical protein
MDNDNNLNVNNNFNQKISKHEYEAFDLELHKSNICDNFDRELINNLKSQTHDTSNANITPPDINLNIKYSNHTNTFTLLGNCLMINHQEISGHDVNNKQNFKNRLKETKSTVFEYLDALKHNLDNYLESQKSHLVNSLTTIETLFDLEPQSMQGEEEKNRMIEKKMEDFSREMNGLLNDLQKICK